MKDFFFIAVDYGIDEPVGSYTKNGDNFYALGAPKYSFSSGIWNNERSRAFIFTIGYTSNLFDTIEFGRYSGYEAHNIMGTSYRQFSFLGGCIFNIEINKRLSMPIQVKLGMLYSTYPYISYSGTEYTYSLNYPAISGTWTSQSANAVAIASSFGLGLNYSISQKIGVGINVDFFYSRPSFNTTTEYPTVEEKYVTYSSGGGYYDFYEVYVSSTGSYRVPIFLFDASLSLSYLFGK